MDTAEQILYDRTGMDINKNPSIKEAMELYASREWIDSNERKPENEKDLNDVDQPFSITVICFGDGISTCGYWNEDMNQWLFEGESLQNCTHWMYLPADPTTK